jgi:signal transduction histidine kinase
VEPTAAPTDASPEPWWAARRRARRSGVFMALVVAAIQVIGCTVAASHQANGRPLGAAGYGLLLLAAAALVPRRAYPVPSLVVALGATATYLAADFPRGPFFLAALVTVFSAAQRVRRELIWTLTAAAYVGYVALSASGAGGLTLQPPSLASYVVLGVVIAVALALAEGTRIRAEHFRELGRVRAAAAQARQEQSRRQASDERLRIARELHDVLGHHLSLINVRAGVALHLLESRPEEVGRALEAIKLASAEALREVRGVLATLDPSDETAPRSPAQGLADLDDLIAAARAAQLPVTVVREGEARPLPAEVDRAAYRIVQEALTNVRRHAGTAATATVRVGYSPDALTLAVEDTGAGSDPSTVDADGNGIPGMRERAVALGGTLVAKARPAGGFQVLAHLPTTTRREAL